jgi:hypothetical protein
LGGGIAATAACVSTYQTHYQDVAHGLRAHFQTFKPCYMKKQQKWNKLTEDKRGDGLKSREIHAFVATS